MFNKFTNQFTLSKSISFELIPQGKTLEHMENGGILDVDKQRNKNFEIVKKGIDEYHKQFIDNALSALTLEGLEEYYELFKIPSKERTEKERRRVFELEADMRKQIASQMQKNDAYHLLFSKDLISTVLPEYFADDENMLEAISSFDGFTTYFKNFHTVRETLYSDERKASSISHRIVNENLPIFAANLEIFDKVNLSPVGDNFIDIENWVGELTGTDGTDGILEYMFSLAHFPSTATQSGIDNYNLLINGYSDEDGFMHKGLNGYINEYNQKVSSKEKLPLFVPLYKQMLSDRESVSFIPDKFTTDQETLDCISAFYDDIKDTLKQLEMLISYIDDYDLAKVFVKNDKAITEISSKLYGNWEYIYKALYYGYDKVNRVKKVKNEDKYAEKRSKYFNSIKSFSIAELNDAIKEYDETTFIPVQEYFKTGMKNGISNFEVIDNAYDELGTLMTEPYPENKKLLNDQKSIDKIKSFLDMMKTWQNNIKALRGSEQESERDALFYGTFTILWNELNSLNSVYNKVRNYLTKKMTATEKVKLNFSNPALGDGWSVGVEREKGLLLFKDTKEDGINHYYLGIIDKGARALFKEYPEPKDASDSIEKMFYYQSADPTKSIMNLMVVDGKTRKVNGRREKNGPHAGENLVLEEMKNTYLPPEINRIRLSRGYSKRSEAFDADDLQLFIAYYKERIKEYMPEFDFGDDFDDIKFNDWNDFTAYIKRKAYQVPMREISKSWLYERVENGELYLFQIYNADFNPNKKGKKKITTRYFEALFDPKNFENGAVYKLNGGAEVFYRPAALDIKDTAIHVANEPVANKNPLNEKKESLFKYNLIKKRKSTKDIFLFNCSIECNFSAEESTPLNLLARKAIREEEKPIVMIGLSRGENHLLYYSVVDEKGNVLEQKSLNVIETVTPNGQIIRSDYHALLDAKENSRQDARKNWKTIDEIKNSKEGYLSQIVSIVTKLMMKYNACIVIEDLGGNFRQSRQKIEKAIYSKFDTALANKLSFLIDKDKADDEVGGLLKPLQLATPDSKDNQNGFMFTAHPAYTTTLDPTTGFANLFGSRLNYTNAKEATLFVKNLSGIEYNKEEDYFEIMFDYASYALGKDSKTNWTVCTYGRRTRGERNRTSGRWEYDSIDLTKEFKAMFKENDIDISENIQLQMLEKATPKLLKGFMNLFKLTLQMRNKVENEDHIVSPVRNIDGYFYNTHENVENAPICAAANSAYNLARKGLLYVDKIREMEDDDKSRLTISNAEWFAAVQK